MPGKKGKQENRSQAETAEILALKFRVAQLEKTLRDQQTRQREAAIGEARMMQTLRSFSTVGIFAADATGKIVSASDGWYRILALNSDDGITADWQTNIHADDRHLFTETLAAQLTEKVTLFRVRGCDGIVRNARMVKRPITTAEGVTGYIGIIEDLIAERTQHAQIAWRQLFDNIPAPVLIVDRQNGLILYVNHAMAEFAGTNASSLTGLSDSSLFTSAEQRESIIAQVSARGYVTDKETMVTVYGGRKKWAQLSCIVSEYDEVTCLVFTLIDITAQRLLIDRLKNSNSKVREIEIALNEHSSVAFTDSEGIITMVNDKFCETAGYSRMELIGNDHRIINSGYHSRDFFRDMWQTIRSGETWRGEVRNRRKDGSFYWADTVIVPFLDADHKPYQYVAIRRDISARKNAELTLARNEAHFRSIAEDMPAHICVFLSDGTITYANDSFARFAGSRPFDLVGSNFYAFLPHGESREMKGTLASLTPSQPMNTRELHLEDHAAQPKFIRWTVKAFFNNAGRIVYCQAFGQDLSQPRRAETQSQQLAQRLRLAADASGQGILVINKREQIVFANAPAQRMLSLALNEIAATYYFREAWQVSGPGDGGNVLSPEVLTGLNGQVTLLDADGNPSELFAKTLVHDGEVIVLLEQNTADADAALVQWLEKEQHERKQLAAEIDGVVLQNLKLLHSMIESLHVALPERESTTVSRIVQMLSETTATASDVMLRLNPAGVKPTGLRQAIEQYLETRAGEISQSTSADLTAIDDFFPDNWNAHFFRLVTEIAETITGEYASVRMSVSARRDATGLVLSLVYDGVMAKSDAAGQDHARINARAALVPARVSWLNRGDKKEVRVSLQKMRIADVI